MTTEICFPGGIQYEDHPDDDSTEVSLQGVGTNEPGNPFTINLNFTTGSGTYCLCGTTPDNMIRLGKWIVETANYIKRKLEVEGD